MALENNIMATHVNNYIFMLPLSTDEPSAIAVLLFDNDPTALNEVYSSTASRYIRWDNILVGYFPYKNGYGSEKVDKTAVDLA